MDRGLREHDTRRGGKNSDISGRVIIMYIIDVILAAQIPKFEAQILSYFAAEKLRPGALVEVTLGRRRLNAVVIASHEAAQQKIAIKKSDFRLKNISKVISHVPAITPLQLSVLKFCAEYYAAPLPAFAKIFLPSYLVRKKTSLFLSDAPQPATPQEEPPQYKPLLIMGPDRTAAYASLLDACLASGKQALFLVPEIAQAYALRETFKKYSPAILTSDMTPKKQFELWNDIRLGNARFVIGTRIAAFAPFSSIGLVVCDEEHNPHFISWDMSPHYDARTIAHKITELSHAQLAFGSNIPSITAFWNAGQNIFALERTVPAAPRVPVHMVDMRNELRDKNFSVFSWQLKNELEKTLSSETGKAILFISRRGSESFLYCRDCGWLLACPRCDAYLVRHLLPKEILVCHHCGFTEAIPSVCAHCKSHRLTLFGAGTQKVKEDIKYFFGYDASLILDSDTAGTFREQEHIVHAFAEGRSRILIGTQALLSKPKMPQADLVAVVSLDNLLYLPEYTVGERVFRTLDSLLKYTKHTGAFLFQTFLPDLDLLKPVVAQSYDAFFSHEIEERKELRLPPFSHMIKITVSEKSSDAAERAAESITQLLKHRIKAGGADIEVLGPAPAYATKIRNEYFWHIVLKIGKVPLPERNRILETVPKTVSVNIDPESLL